MASVTLQNPPPTFKLEQIVNEVRQHGNAQIQNPQVVVGTPNVLANVNGGKASNADFSTPQGIVDATNRNELENQFVATKVAEAKDRTTVVRGLLRSRSDNLESIFR